MNKFLMFILVFISIGLIFLGMIFIIAWGLDNIIAGLVMVMIAFALIFFIYRSNKIEASQPKLINQTFNVQMSGSGQFQETEMKCKSCGGAIGKKDVKVIEGGLAVTCPYCGSAYTLEEQPKW